MFTKHQSYIGHAHEKHDRPTSQVTSLRLSRLQQLALSQLIRLWSTYIIIAQLPGAGHKVLQPGHVPRLAPPWCRHCQQHSVSNNISLSNAHLRPWHYRTVTQSGIAPNFSQKGDKFVQHSFWAIRKIGQRRYCCHNRPYQEYTQKVDGMVA